LERIKDGSVHSINCLLSVKNCAFKRGFNLNENILLVGNLYYITLQLLRDIEENCMSSFNLLKYIQHQQNCAKHYAVLFQIYLWYLGNFTLSSKHVLYMIR